MSKLKEPYLERNLLLFVGAFDAKLWKRVCHWIFNRKLVICWLIFLTHISFENHQYEYFLLLLSSLPAEGSCSDTASTITAVSALSLPDGMRVSLQPTAQKATTLWVCLSYKCVSLRNVEKTLWSLHHLCNQFFEWNACCEGTFAIFVSDKWSEGIYRIEHALQCIRNSYVHQNPQNCHCCSRHYSRLKIPDWRCFCQNLLTSRVVFNYDVQK